MNTLFLRLEGPLQSWGTRGRFSERDTAAEPTKSGVVGLIACAMGLGPEQDEEIRDLDHGLRMGVRVDRPGVYLRDYHTVVGGVRSAEGKIKITASTHLPETVVSQRYYLADASFLVAVQAAPSAPPTLLTRAADAVRDPVWPPYLGRRSCPPSVPLWAGEGDFSTLVDALGSHDWPVGRDTTLRAVVDAESGTGWTRSESIQSLASRVYGPRSVVEVLVSPREGAG